MTNYIKKHFNKILIIFILIQPILDLITGIFIHTFKINITIGIVIRMLFLLFIMFSTIFIYKKKKNLIYYILFIIYSIFYLGGIFFYTNNSLLIETQGLFRTFYFPILLISLYSIKDEIKIDKKILFYSLLIYLLLIIIPTIFNIGFKTYEITKSGTLGFFNSANEISGIISLLTPIMIMVFVENKKYIYTVIISIIYLLVILNIGTKTPLLTLVIITIFSILWLWIKNIKEKNYKIVGISFTILLVVSILIISIIPKTNFYKNIETHLEFLKVDNVIDVLEKPRLIDHFIFSQRLTFLSKRQKDYNKANTYQKIFGIGSLKNNKPTKAIEMDYFDIYYNHGLIGFIVFFISYIHVLIKVFKNKIKLNFNRYMLYVSLFLILFLSLFTGHIITAPAVSIVSCMLIILLFDKSLTCIKPNKVL